MPDTDEQTVEPGPDAQSDDPFDFEQLPENVKSHIRGLRSEAKGHRLDKRDLEQQLTETTAKLSTAEESRKSQLERQGDYETLSRQQEQELAELRIKAEKADRLEKSIIERNTERVKKLPEHMRVLFPASLSPEDQSTWLDEAIPKLTAPPIPDFDGGAGGQGRRGSGSAVKLTSDEKKVAAAMGITEEQYAAGKLKS